MKTMYFISAGLALLSVLALAPSVSAWPGKRESKKSEQLVYPLGPDAEGYYTSSTGLKFKDIKKGEGPRPRAGQTVVVHYTGWLQDGTKFDSSVDRGQPLDFVLGSGTVIKGWEEGVKGMYIGGQRKLLIPPKLGYGEKGSGDAIPPNATLLFDVQLLGVK